MTFLHKLAQRLARLRTALIMAVVATIACEIPLRQSDPSGDVALLQLSPQTVTLGTDQIAQFVVVGFTSTGDTAHFSVTWSASGGSIVDTSTIGGRHYVDYKAPSQPGQYEVIIQITAAGPSARRAVAELSATSTAAGLSDSAVVNVTAVPVASVGVSPSAVGATVGDQAQFTATLQDVNGNVLTGRVVTWASSNTGVATVNGSGLVTAVAAGLSIITATSEGKNGTAGITVTLTPAAVASVSVAPASTSVAVGQTVQLTATPRDASGNVLLGRVVTWVSSDVSLATVSSSGLVTGVAVGGVTITATSEGQSGSSAVTVLAPVASVGVSPASPSVIAGQTVQLTATPRDASGNALTGRVVTWGSSNTAVATVNGSGLVTGVAAGSATITATSEGRSGTAAVTVTPAPVASVSVSPASASVTTGSAVQLTATPRDASGNALTGRVITWASSNVAVATVSGSGLVSGVASGSATITASSEGRSGTSAITVTPPGSNPWPNAPAGWTTLLDTPFSIAGSDTQNGPEGWYYYSGASLISDPTAPLSPSSVMQIVFPVGLTAGNGGGSVSRLSGNRTSHYVGFWTKVNSDFENPKGFKQGWYPAGDNFGYALIIEGENQGSAAWTMRLEGNGMNAPSNVVGKKFTPGVWHQIEILWDAPTHVLKFWMDNVLVGNHTLPSWSDTFTYWRFIPVWGPNLPNEHSTVANYFWVDHCIVKAP
jgi:uncharacterized protein YjdB